MAGDSGAALDAGTGDIVEHILRRQRPARCLAMGAQHQGFRVPRIEMPLHHAGPDLACGAQLGDLHEVMHAIGKEEGQARRKGVDIQPGRHPGAHIFQTVGKRIGQFQVVRRAGLLHMIAGHRNEIELRHLGRAIGKDIRDNPHRGCRRIDIGIAHHEFLQNIVLDGACQGGRRNALLLGSGDEQRQHRHDRAIHRHGDGHAVQRNVAEQDVHVGDGIDRHPGHADIVRDKLVIGVIAPVRRQIERHRQAHLPGRQIATVEGV